MCIEGDPTRTLGNLALESLVELMDQAPAVMRSQLPDLFRVCVRPLLTGEEGEIGQGLSRNYAVRRGCGCVPEIGFPRELAQWWALAVF